MVIDIVCTEYPSNLSLTALNNKRLETFLKLFPFLRKSQIVAINIYRQLDGSTKQTADTMFHGLVVKYRPKQNAESMQRDVAKLEEMLLPVPGYDSTPLPHAPANPPFMAKDTFAKIAAPEKGYKQYRAIHARKPGSQWLQMTITPDASTASSNKKNLLWRHQYIYHQQPFNRGFPHIHNAARSAGKKNYFTGAVQRV